MISISRALTTVVVVGVLCFVAGFAYGNMVSTTNRVQTAAKRGTPIPLPSDLPTCKGSWQYTNAATYNAFVCLP